MKRVEDYITDVPDFPKEGIIFHDITSVLQDADGLQLSVDKMKEAIGDTEFDLVAGLESRGFLFGMPLAYMMHKPFIPIRKKGKLPRSVIAEEYDLEYGSAEIEIHTDAIKPGQKVILIDDLIATGGTIEAACHLVEKLGGIVVKLVFLMELKGLEGRELLKDYDVVSVVSYEGK